MYLRKTNRVNGGVDAFDSLTLFAGLSLCRLFQPNQ